MSLRIKLMLALFVTGLAAVAMVGGLTSYSVHSKFDTIRSRQAADHFHHYMTAYLAEYGDWETAISTESFDRFVQRREAAEAPPQGERPSEMLDRMPPGIDQKSHQSEPVAGEPDRPRAPAYGAPGQPAAGLADGQRSPAHGAPAQPQGGQQNGPRPPAYGAPRPNGQPPEGAVPGQPRVGADDGRAPRDGMRPPPPDGHRPPPDGQPWPPHDGMRPPPPDGMRPPPQDGMRPPPHDGMRPPPRDGMRPPADGTRPPPRDGM
ncbi:MAG: hypothetical protein K2X55_11795, partial [Burkholderiaceae bacterium]|nr:hypothetical protein [Burkholderiaceae bacterium]